MGNLRMEAKKEKESLQFVAVKADLEMPRVDDRGNGESGLKLRYGYFSIEVKPGFDQVTLGEVLCVIKSSQC